MIKVEIKNVSLRYPIYGFNDYSIRNVTINTLVGGKLLQKNKDLFIEALRDINFVAIDGDRIGLYGHNGSGKTTLLRVIIGVLKPTDGKIVTDGKISSMLSLNMGIDLSFTARELIKLKSKFMNLSLEKEKRLMDDVIEFTELNQYIDLPLYTFSTGMMMRLSFAIATHDRADILVLDEWLSAGDEKFSIKAHDRMKAFIKKSGLLFLATHDKNLLANTCNKIITLEKGEIKGVERT